MKKGIFFSKGTTVREKSKTKSNSKAKMLKIEYPYQNLSLKNIRGEVWKPVPGYHDYYEVSNYGRVKSLERNIAFFIPGRHLVSFLKPEKVLRQGIKKRRNNISKDYSYDLTVTFCIDQVMKTFSVASLVRNAFLNDIDDGKDNLCITHKDGDGRNNRYNNLQLVSRSESGKRAYKENRLIHLHEYITESLIAKRSHTRWKPVTQYDLNGNRLHIYACIKHAEAKTGIFHSNISLAAKNKTRQMGGFLWRYGKGRAKINASVYHDNIKRFRNSFLKPVTQYSLNGKRLGTYPSIKSAATAVGCRAGSISSAVRGVYKTAGGYIWRAGKTKRNI